MDYVNFRNLNDQEKIKVNTTCTNYERIRIQEFGESSGQAPRQKQDSSMKTEVMSSSLKTDFVRYPLNVISVFYE